MEIRDFIPDDWQMYKTFSEDFYSGGATLYPTKEEYLRATFDACCERSPYTRGIMFLQEGKPAGYGLLSFTWSAEVGGLVVLLEEIYIAPDWRGHGMGKFFIQWAMDTYPEAKRYRLEACESNPGAVRLYEKMGFTYLEYLQMVKENS